MCPDLRGLLISSSGFTDHAIRDLSSILPQQPCVLCHIEEIVLLLEQGRDLKDLLQRGSAPETEQKPVVQVRVRGA